MACTTTRTEQVVAGSADEERTAPISIVATTGNILAGDPDRVAIDSRCTIITPARANWVREHLRLVPCETIFRCRSRTAIDNVPCANADERIDRRIGCARI